MNTYELRFKGYEPGKDDPAIFIKRVRAADEAALWRMLRKAWGGGSLDGPPTKIPDVLHAEADLTVIGVTDQAAGVVNGWAERSRQERRRKGYRAHHRAFTAPLTEQEIQDCRHGLGYVTAAVRVPLVDLVNQGGGDFYTDVVGGFFPGRTMRDIEYRVVGHVRGEDSEHPEGCVDILVTGHVGDREPG